MNAPVSAFSCAALIKEIGRGARGARHLSRTDAQALYAAILAGHVSDLELGAVLIALRVKGENADELAGMLDAAHASLTRLQAPAHTVPVVVPSYNGARKQANLVPLLALLLARAGVPVLIHGLTTDATGRATTAEILAALQIQPATSLAAAEGALRDQRLAFVPIDVLSPALARQLSLRAILGVRNSAHMLVKMLQPFAQPALRLVNYTHPLYRDTLVEHFRLPGTAGAAGVLLARGTEGEPVADTTFPRAIEWLTEAGQEIAMPGAAPRTRATPELPASHDVATTAAWIQRALAGEVAVPDAITAQIDAIQRAVAGKALPA